MLHVPCGVGAHNSQTDVCAHVTVLDARRCVDDMMRRYQLTKSDLASLESQTRKMFGKSEVTASHVLVWLNT